MVWTYSLYTSQPVAWLAAAAAAAAATASQLGAAPARITAVT